MNVEARLTHRGETFEVTIDGKTFEGFCSWTYREKEGGERPVPDYPVAIEAETISRIGIAALVGLSAVRKRKIAILAARALEEGEAGSEYVAYYEGARL